MALSVAPTVENETQHMSHSLKSLNGENIGDNGTLVIKGDTRSLDYSSYEHGMYMGGFPTFRGTVPEQ